MSFMASFLAKIGITRRARNALACLCVGLIATFSTIEAGAGENGTGENSKGPWVVASIAPVHSLAAMVMEGVAVPRLLLPGGMSPHSYALKPSDARALVRARLVIWIGPGLERFLVRPLATLARHSKKLALAKVAGLILRPARGGGLWPTPEHGPQAVDDQHPGQGQARGRPRDPHIWLDPRNAVTMVGEIARVMARMDPANGARYRANGRRAMVRITSLDAALEARLKPYRAVPYFVFHDAYGYFEGRYGLNALGAVVAGPDQRPGIKSLRAIRAGIRRGRAACIFAQSEFGRARAVTITEGTGAVVGVADPLGVGLAPGPKLYPALLDGLAKGLVNCLSSHARP